MIVNLSILYSKMSCTIYGKRFFYRYISKAGKVGLDSEESLNDTSFIICWERKSKPRVYTYFSNLIFFVNWMVKDVPKNEWCFHEVIRSNVIQRIRFDIDIEIEKFQDHFNKAKNLLEYGELVQENLIDAIIEYFAEMNITLNLEKDIVICDSTSSQKFSRHLILPNHSTSNSDNAKQYFERIIKKCDANYSLFIDEGIYSSMHNLRLLGSVKLDTTRVKVFNENWTAIVVVGGVVVAIVAITWQR